MIALRQLSRTGAATLHLGISAATAAAAMTLMLALWYPSPLFDAMGGKVLLMLIVGVDVAIGPLLTLIVFDPRKKELIFDLSVVALLQLSALVYGIYALHAARPAFVVFVDNQFTVVAAASIEDEARAHARPEFRTLPELGPTVVAVDMPTDVEARNEILFAGLGGLGIQHLPRYYVPYAERATQVIAAAQPLDRLHVASDDEKKVVNDAVARLRKTSKELRFLPVVTEYAKLTALIDAKTGALLAMVAAHPLEHHVTTPVRTSS